MSAPEALVFPLPTIPEAYKNAPLADKRNGLLEAVTNADTKSALFNAWKPGRWELDELPDGWKCFNSENLVSESIHDPFKFSNRPCWLSKLGKRISEALLLESLIEVFGPEGLSTDSSEDVDGYKQNWVYELIHTSGRARLKFHDYEGLPRINFTSSVPFISKVLEAINFLILGPVLLPINEAKYRHTISEKFMLRHVDIKILKDYHRSWSHDDQGAAERKKVEYSEIWAAQKSRHALSESSRLVTWSSVNQAVNLVPIAHKSPEFEDDFNTRISPQILLLRLLLTFGAHFWQDENTVWGMTLKHGSDCWLQISNQSGYLSLECEGSDADEKAGKLASYLISEDVVTLYDGSIAGRVAY
ncbi:hypothetical protein O988_02709 [Pseudogymnoascus sp. VKM F-3808]|nr:hypothetical protein O988_02709 [Pseudogymnoascus sp. VKM F-3808]